MYYYLKGVYLHTTNDAAMKNISIKMLCAATVALSLSFNSCAPKDSPLPQGEAVEAVTAAADEVFADIRSKSTNDIHSMVILKGGKVIYERYAPGERPEYLHILWSASKTFTATAIGFAVQDGLLSVDDLVEKFFSADELPAERFPQMDTLTVKHLLTMSSGFRKDFLGPTESGRLEHPALETLSSGFMFSPGTDYHYNSMNTYLLSAIVTKVTGMTCEEYLDGKLFRPLGIRDHIWETSVEGYNMGGWGLHITTRSLAKMGQFFLQRGMWNGKQLLQECWFDEAMSVQIETPKMPLEQWKHGYGYQMWHCSVPGVFRLDGARGQFSFIIPDKDAVVAMNCHTADTEGAIDSVLDRIYPVL